ncbi:MAG TPA: YciI family protein [Mycobacteriales bacterium]|jgi:hypothetical protein|nr:YciI family protein [Mycobacteriales bacterium]
MSRYLMLLNADQPPTPPPPGLMEAIMTLGEEATRAGVLLDTQGLAPSAAGSRVTLSGGRLSVTDGPFAETKEIISYAVYELRSKEEAVEWASRFLTLHRDLWPGWTGDAEIRRVFGPEDFAGPGAAPGPPVDR